eukprot:scaffold2476_cov193-Amphora_coffeaeformis.AAC.13
MDPDAASSLARDRASGSKSPSTDRNTVKEVKYGDADKEPQGFGCPIILAARDPPGMDRENDAAKAGRTSRSRKGLIARVMAVVALLPSLSYATTMLTLSSNSVVAVD